MQLFKEGFDVWLGNNRGTRNSRKHTIYDADRDAELYWDFTLEEYAMSDISAMLETIYSHTADCRKISYVGHSLGNTQIFYNLA